MQRDIAREGRHDIHGFGQFAIPETKHSYPTPALPVPRTDLLKHQTARDNTNELSMHTSRIGHHIREVIVEEAQATLGYRHDLEHSASDGAPEPIPDTQEEINVQADAALRELFPRIPNTDRQEIIDHAFRKVCPSTSTDHASCYLTSFREQNSTVSRWSV